MGKSNVAKAGVGYTLANVLIRGIGFLTLPIFSRVMDTYDFGVYNVFIAYDAILFVVIGLALHSSVKSANWEFVGKIDEYISSVSVLYLINMMALIAVSVLFGSLISQAIGLEIPIIIALIAHSFGTAIVTLYNNRISLQYSYRKYMVVAATSSLGNVALSLILIFTLCNGCRYMGRILGSTIVLALLGAVLICYFWRLAKPRIDLAFWKFGIKYSLPIVAHGLSQVALAQLGRLMINYMVSTVAAGIYGLAANITIIATVLVDSISTVWDTWFYEVMEGESASEATKEKLLTRESLQEKAEEIQKRARQLTLGFSMVCVALMSLAPEIIWVLGGSAYKEGAYCVPGMVLSGFCIFLYNLIVVGEYYKQKTTYIMLGTFAAAVVNVILNYIVLKKYGYVAVAYSTLASYAFYVLFHWIICWRLLGFSILRPASTLAICAVLCLSATADLIFFDSIIIRICVGITVFVPMLYILLKEAGGLDGVRRLVGR